MFREFVVARRRSVQEYERDLTLAWHVANLSGPGKKLPELSALLKRVRQAYQRQEKQTHAQLRTSLQMLSERYGIPLRRMTLVKRKERPA